MNNVITKTAEKRNWQCGMCKKKEMTETEAYEHTPICPKNPNPGSTDVIIITIPCELISAIKEYREQETNKQCDSASN